MAQTLTKVVLYAIAAIVVIGIVGGILWSRL